LKKHQKYLCKFLLFIFLKTLPVYSSTYQYTGTYKKNPVTASYTFTNKKGLNYITSKIYSNKIDEINTTTLKNNGLIKMKQLTRNDIDQEYFTWHINKQKNELFIRFENDRFNEIFTGKLATQNNPITLQGLLYIIQHLNINVGNVYTVNLITPWKTMMPLRFKVIEETTLKIENYDVESYFIKLELNLFFRAILPNASIWVSKSKPHILLKQIDFRSQYIIKNIENALNQTIGESP
jgi:hypothetical protein